MTKWILLIILVLALPLVIGELKAEYPICQATRDIHTDCTMITPSIHCTAYTYDILNLSGGAQISGGTLVEFNESIYYFNFTLDEGEYLVRLCDNTTREVRVIPADDNMLPAIIVLIPILIGFALIMVARSLNEEHNVLRIFLFLFSFICFFTSLHWGAMSVIRLYGYTELADQMGTTTVTLGIIFGVIIMYFLIYMIYKMIRAANQDKDDKLEY